MLKSQNFIVSFFYRRFHIVGGAQVSLDIMEEDAQEMTEIDIYYNDEIQTRISLGKHCTLVQLRMDLINEDEVELPEDFVFKINNLKVRIPLKNCINQNEVHTS